ncbi:hypothetical protein Barb7_02205 [Bacteroidales bacterium Barb7]|nr:hypothetical protein Barb7_02205 [Bacteroidales bacterium Barb7]
MVALQQVFQCRGNADAIQTEKETSISRSNLHEGNLVLHSFGKAGTGFGVKAQAGELHQVINRFDSLLLRSNKDNSAVELFYFEKGHFLFRYRLQVVCHDCESSVSMFSSILYRRVWSAFKAFRACCPQYSRKLVWHKARASRMTNSFPWRKSDRKLPMS